MVTISIKGTYSLDPETVRLLGEMARHWGVSKSEALRRAIRSAAQSRSANPAIAALDRLQRGAVKEAAPLAKWADEIPVQRKASEKRRRSRK